MFCGEPEPSTQELAEFEVGGSGMSLAGYEVPELTRRCATTNTTHSCKNSPAAKPEKFTSSLERRTNEKPRKPSSN
jgi:hypothetical protein